MTAGERARAGEPPGAALRAVARPGLETIAIARHGQTADNAGGRILGHRDPPLSEVGQTQALALADAAAEWGVRRLWCSPLLRARQTAAAVGERVGVRPRVLDELAESRRGAWEGRLHAELREQQPELWAAFVAGSAGFAFPGGESLAAQVERTARALETVLAEGLPALVVAHAGTIRAALTLAGEPLPPERALANGEVGIVVAPRVTRRA